MPSNLTLLACVVPDPSLRGCIDRLSDMAYPSLEEVGRGQGYREPGVTTVLTTTKTTNCIIAKLHFRILFQSLDQVDCLLKTSYKSGTSNMWNSLEALSTISPTMPEPLRLFLSADQLDRHSLYHNRHMDFSTIAAPASGRSIRYQHQYLTSTARQVGWEIYSTAPSPPLIFSPSPFPPKLPSESIISNMAILQCLHKTKNDFGRELTWPLLFTAGYASVRPPSKIPQPSSHN